MLFISSRLKDDNGGITVFTVIWLTIFLTIMSLCLDVGKMIVTRHELQSVADAGALAGASAFSIDYVFDASGNTIGFNYKLNKSSADALSGIVMNRNLSLKNFSSQDIKVVEIESKVKDSGNFGRPEYSVFIGADTKMFILGAFGKGVVRVTVVAKADVNFK